MAVEVVRPEVVVLGAVLENVEDGGEDRGCDGTDGFLRSAPALQSEELGFVSSYPCSKPGRCSADVRLLKGA
jgi:hypothetical protein